MVLKKYINALNSITTDVCEDDVTVEAKAKCEKYKEWCDKNSFVTKRCQKTCGKCSKLPY